MMDFDSMVPFLDGTRLTPHTYLSLMSQRYLLPCSCGKTVPVGISQAGATATCECGKSLPVPSIRGLKGLPSENQDSATPATKTAAEINGLNLQGIAFVLGFLLLIGGLALGGWYGYLYSQIDVKDYTFEIDQDVDKQIDSWDAMTMYGYWNHLNETGLEDYQLPSHVIAREYSAVAFRWMTAGIVMLLVGLGLCVYSVLGSSLVRRST